MKRILLKLFNLNMMGINKATCGIATAVALLISCECESQTSMDRTKIYQIVIQKISDKSLPIVNETLGKIYEYDIDGDLEKWILRQRNTTTSDTSILTGSIISVTPIQYSQPIAQFLRTKNISFSQPDLLAQVDEVGLDSLNKYLPDLKLTSFNKAPLSKSFASNLFKKKAVIILSGILFDEQDSIAVVKIQKLSRNKSSVQNPSSIVLFKKVGAEWIIIGSLDAKEQQKGALIL